MTGSSNISGLNPLSYLGVTPVSPAPVYFSRRAPTTDDIKNFTLSTVWIDEDSQDAYMLVNKDNNVATWIRLGGTPSDVSQFTMPNSDVVEPISGNVNFLNGTGISITGSTPGITITATATPFVVPWSVVGASTQTIAINEGYFANNPTGVTFTLPAVAALGSYITISSINAGGWVINQNASQTIYMGNTATTTTTGSLSSTDLGDTVALVCSVADTDFVVIHSLGNIQIT